MVDITTVQKKVNSMNPKYISNYYWDYLLQKRRIPSQFNQETITERSLFFYGVLYNSYGRQKLVEEILHFKELDALIGYLYHVYLPMAFLSFTNQEKGIAMPVGVTLEEIVSYASQNEFVRYHAYQQSMYEILFLLQMVLDQHSSPGMMETMLKRSIQIFNQSFQRDKDAYGKIQVYASPEALGQHFAVLYQIDGDKTLGEKIFKSRTGLNKAEWEALCRDASHNIFSSKKFMNTIESLKHRQSVENKIY